MKEIVETDMNIGKNIGILCRQLNIYLNRALSEYDITASEIMYLGSLFIRDGVTQEELSDEFCVDKAATARTLSSLESKGLVYRRSHDSDKRSKLVFLTDSADRFRNVLSDIQQRWCSDVLVGTDRTKTEEFACVLETIASGTRRINETTEHQK